MRSIFNGRQLIARIGDRLLCSSSSSNGKLVAGSNGSQALAPDDATVSCSNRNGDVELPATLVRERRAKKRNGGGDKGEVDVLGQMCTLLCSAGVGKSPRKRRPIQPPPPYVRDQVLRGSSTGRSDAEMIVSVLESKASSEERVDEALHGLSCTLTHEVVCRVVLGAEKLSTVCSFFRWACSQGYKPSILVCNSVFQVLVRHGRVEEAYDRFSRLEEEQVKPNCFTYSILMEGLAAGGNVEAALSMFEDVKKLGQEFVRTCSQYLIRGMCTSGKVEEAMEQYQKLRASRFRLEVGCYNYLIDGLVRNRLLDKALVVRKHMDEDYCKPNEHTYRPLISGLTQRNRLAEACDLLEEMLSKGYTPDAVTYTMLVDALCKSRQFDKACMFIDRIEAPDIVTYTTLVDGLCDLGKLDQAFELVEQITERGNKVDTVLYTILMKGLCRERQTDNALKMLDKMLETGCVPTSVTYNTLMQGLVREGRLAEARALLDEMLAKGIQPDAVTYRIICEDFAKRPSYDLEAARKVVDELTEDDGLASSAALIEKLSRRNEMEEALQVFEVMSRPLPISASAALVRGLVKEGNLVEAGKLVDEMLKRGSVPSLQFRHAIVSGLYHLMKEKKLDDVMKQAIEMLRSGGYAPSSLWCSLFVEALAIAGHLQYAYEFAIEVESTFNDHMWEVLLAKLCDAGESTRALEVLKLQQERGCKIHFKSYQGVIQCLLDAGAVKEAMEQFTVMLSRSKCSEWPVVMVHGRWISHFCTLDVDKARETLQLLVDRGICPLTRSYNVLMECYFKLGRFDEAVKLFEQIPSPNSSTYTILIDEYCRNEMLDKAFEAFEDMVLHGFQPLYTTYNVLVRKLCKAEKVDEAYHVLHQLVRMGRQPPLVTYDAVFQGYFEASRFDRARQVFDDMTKMFRLDSRRPADFHLKEEQLRKIMS